MTDATPMKAKAPPTTMVTALSAGSYTEDTDAGQSTRLPTAFPIALRIGGRSAPTVQLTSSGATIYNQFTATFWRPRQESNLRPAV